MPTDATQRHENLSRLCQQLEAHAESCGSAFPVSPLALKLSGSLFLAHSRSLEAFSRICQDGSLSSRKKLDAEGTRPLDPNCDECLLGTSDCVFFYVGPFRYPSTNCGLLFTGALEVEHRISGIATPFDSGALINHYFRPDSLETPQEFLARHELPIPEHRDYLGHSMTALFRDPVDYVAGKAPHHLAPIELGEGVDERQWTHEVRIPSQVQVRGSVHLHAVFVPLRAVAEASIESLLGACERAGIETIIVNSSHDGEFQALKDRCLVYLQRELYSSDEAAQADRGS